MNRKDNDLDAGYANPRYRWYFEEKRLHEASRQSQTDAFDSAILTLSSGAFGISIAFLTLLKTTVVKGTTIYLISSWVLFALAIVSTLVSFKLAEKAHDKQIDELTKLYERPDYRVKANATSTATGWINYLSLVLFVVGLGLFSVFVISNLK